MSRSSGIVGTSIWSFLDEQQESLKGNQSKPGLPIQSREKSRPKIQVNLDDADKHFLSLVFWITLI